ncbi:MAG: Mur ligase [Candidatus Eisenbacteria bacterium]|nr:Mur ligase [Candidatus Eisenbacteria bacterium]
MLIDSRRLTGSNPWLPGLGAIIEVERPDGEAAVAAWREEVARILTALGRDAVLGTRVHPGGAAMALTAPSDALFAATEVNELAWFCAEARLDGRLMPDLAQLLPGIMTIFVAEANPALRALESASERRDLSILRDDEQISIGLGHGSRGWPLRNLPSPDQVEWSELHDIPVALVTGTNGKTTSVRLTAAMLAASGLRVGTSSTDGITVQEESIAAGDYSGPAGARRVLRHPAVEAAVLESARGGILRRGLAIDRVGAALVTNVAADHLGEFGVSSIHDLLETKLVVATAVRPEGAIVLNADDPFILAEAPRILSTARVRAAIVWFSLRDTHPVVLQHLEEGGRACFVEHGEFVHATREAREHFGAVQDAPITWDGTARHNISNVLGAIGLARALQVPPSAIRSALCAFASTNDQNPGRLNRYEVNGSTFILDFAHNPHGWRALVEVARAHPARRRAVALGQAGDRDDASIRELAQIVWTLQPELIVVKEVEAYLRGRPRGEVSRILGEEFARLGVPADRVVSAAGEAEALERLLLWAGVGDLVLMPVLAERAQVSARLAALTSRRSEPDRPPGSAVEGEAT